MIITQDTQIQLISETTTGSGGTSRSGIISSDAILASLWVNSLTSGSLDISVYTLTEEGKQVQLFSFPSLTAPSSTLLLKKSGVSLQRFLVTAIYTGICSYEVYIRAISSPGESSVSMTGATSLITNSGIVTSTPGVLLPPSLVDRQGLVIKHWGSSGNLFISESLAKLPGQAWPLAPRDALALDIAAGVTIYAVTDSGPVDVRFAAAGA